MVKYDVDVGKSAYTLVIVVMFIIFMMITAVVGVTASGRRTSGQYIRFAGLYDLALAGSERVMILLQDEVDAYLEDRLVLRLLDEGVMEFLVDGKIDGSIDGNNSYGGEFLLNDYFLPLLRAEKRGIAAEFLATPGRFGRSQGRYYFSYSLSLATGTYEVRTEIWLRTGGAGVYEVRSTARKIVGEPPGPLGAETVVYGRLEWPTTFTSRARIIPIAYEIDDYDNMQITELELDLSPLGELGPRLAGVWHIAN